ncbi:hypothetical protein B0H63DRAFT_560644 [Podospora didyma]|uniref:NACHT domain-containing protein n=1 Tax=Podospora didyma TaxID=330526 RepID=A0AAE0NG13_9PEZI|nr:hypothetical protein B0H63DRAFT_560644 [Podospora didyma]
MAVALWIWAGDKRAVQASFFFRGSGLPLQKTEKGVSRTHTDAFDTRLPLAMLQKIRDNREVLQFKFCLFIDGPDEYEGEAETIVEALQILSTSPNIKLCVSSRPWLPFVKAFNREQRTLVA